MDDIERASDSTADGKLQRNCDHERMWEKAKRRERIRALVGCRAERERIMGGDRMDGDELNDLIVSFSL